MMELQDQAQNIPELPIQNHEIADQPNQHSQVNHQDIYIPQVSSLIEAIENLEQIENRQN